MSSKKSVAFIINPKAGIKHKIDFGKLIAKTFDAQQYDYSIKLTESAGHATQLAADAVAMQVQYICAIGGDGTINEAARSVAGTNSILAIVPSGSGNGFARHCQIPLNAHSALKLISQGKVMRTDTFRVNDLFAMNIAGIGFEAHIAHLFANTEGRGLYNYARLVLKEFKSFEKFRCTINAGDAELNREVFSMAFANSSQYGNNAQIAPGASIVDEKLNLVLLDKISILQAPSFTYKVFKGKTTESSLIETFSFKTLDVSCPYEVALHIDGDPAGFAKTFRIEINPASLNLLVPLNHFRI